MLYADGRFATPDGRARFSAIGAAAEDGRATITIPSPPSGPAERVFRVSTRRGKQFNSMVQREVDPLTGAARDDVLMSGTDLERLGLRPGQRVTLRAPAGTLVGTVRKAAIKPGNLEVHWPEGNVLLTSSAIDPDSMEPDYNASVMVEPVEEHER